MAIMATVEAIKTVSYLQMKSAWKTLSESRRLSRLVGTCFTSQDLRTEGAKFSPESVNVVAMVAKYCCCAETFLQENNRTLTFVDKTPEGNCFIDINSDMIEALTNLLSNAIHTPMMEAM